MEWENRRYPWGGRQFSYSDWLIAQSCQEQEGTGHQESEEKWLELWVRRKKGQLLFISIERTTYVVWENRFGEESALVRKTASLFSSSRLFSSCQTWWKVHTIFAETLRQVSYYTTIVLKTRWTTQFFSNPPVRVFFLFGFFPCHSFCLCVCGLFCQHKGSRICHYTEWQLSELGSLSSWCPRGTEHRRRERLSEAFWSAANAISWCHVLSALLFTSPL